MQEDQVGLCIFTQYYGPIEDGSIIAKSQPLGTIEETASLAQLVPTFRIHLPDGSYIRAVCIVERECSRLEREELAGRGT